MANGDLYLSDSPNVDKGYVEQDSSLRKVTLTAVPEGTLELSNSANVSTGYVTDSDSKKHKVNLVAEVEGTLELSDNPSVDTAYVTDNNNKKHKVNLVATLHGGGSAPVIDELNVTPSTSAQTITAPSGTDGYSPINVSAVTSSIDANITAGNIKKDVQILGVTGSYEGTTPTGTKSITANGVYDVSTYASADVQVPSTAPDFYIFRNVSTNYQGKTLYSNNITEPTGFNLDDVYQGYGNYIFAYAFYGNTNLQHFPDFSVMGRTYGRIDLPRGAFFHTFDGCTNATGIFKLNDNVTTFGAEEGFGYMFNNCTGLTKVDFNNCTTLLGNPSCADMFRGCTGITEVNMKKIQSLGGNNACSNMFYGCTGITSIDLSGLTTVGMGHLAYMFQNCTGLISADLSGLVDITNNSNSAFNYTFGGCTSLTSVDLSNLKYCRGIGTSLSYTFQNCTSLTNVNIRSLISSDGGFFHTFQGCTSLTDFEFKSLQSVGSQAFVATFYGCTNLTTVKFKSLDGLNSAGSYGYFKDYSNNNACFRNCSSLGSVWFYALQNAVDASFNSMLYTCVGVTVHFPKNMQSTMSNWSNVTNGFGGTNTTVLFDIITSLIGADTNTYSRQEKDSTSTATAWVSNDILYYTSGTTEPQVGDTIYSDSTCTTAVTTISSIA